MSSKVRNFLRQNAIALLALYIALGGVAVAVKSASSPPKNSVKSKQIKDGQVKTQDIADQAVTGAKVAGAAIGTNQVGPDALTGANVQEASLAKVPSADTLDTLDSADVLSDGGLTQISVGPSEWVTFVNSAATFVPEYSAPVVQFKSQTASGTGAAEMHPTVPTMIAGRQTRVRAVTVCYDGGNANASITRVLVRVFEGPPAGASVTTVDTVDDQTTRDDAACRRYEFANPVPMTSDRELGVSVNASWTASFATISFTATTIELDFVP
jgi:hypothetical protein